MFRYNFNDVISGQAAENETSIVDPVWNVSDGNGGALNVRRSTPRNAPPVINAVFDYRNFWDGRAQSAFNGVNPSARAIPARIFCKSIPATRARPSKSRCVSPTLRWLRRRSGLRAATWRCPPPGARLLKMGKEILTLSPWPCSRLRRMIAFSARSALFPAMALPPTMSP